MHSFKKLFVAFFVGAAAVTAQAAIIPSWRINPISSGAIIASPSLGSAISVSLMVELTDGSLFNAAGLDLTPVIGINGVQYYNHPAFGTDTTPPVGGPPIFPDLQFDSYVGTTSGSSQPPSIPGKLNGIGPAQVGSGGQFNVAWVANPNTGGTGPREIARITVLNAVFASIDVPLSRGFVADSLNPNTNIPLPPIPIVAIPEPLGLSLVCLGAMALRRRKFR